MGKDKVDKSPLNIKLPNNLIKKIKDNAKHEKRAVSSQVEVYIEKGLQKIEEEIMAKQFYEEHLEYMKFMKEEMVENEVKKELEHPRKHNDGFITNGEQTVIIDNFFKRKRRYQEFIDKEKEFDKFLENERDKEF